MVTLSKLGDVTKFYNDSFKNDVFVITDDQPVKCNGVLLAARSVIIEEILRESENIPANQFSDDLAGLMDCIHLIYGASVVVCHTNYRSIFKFGKLFQIKEMQDIVLNWVAEDLPLEEFWQVYLDLKKLDENGTSAAFSYVVKKYVSNHPDDFLKSAVEICLGFDFKTVVDVIEMLMATNSISCDQILTFFSDLLNKSKTTDCDATPTSTSTSSSTRRVDTAISWVMYYMEKPGFDITSKHYTDVLSKVSSMTNDVEILHRIVKLLSTASQFKDICMYPTNKISRELVQKLTLPSTPFNVIRCFTDYTGNDLHPCILGEIVLKWWSVREGECADTSFIKALFIRTQNRFNEWLGDVYSDSRYFDLILTFGITFPSVERYLQYNIYNNNSLSKLKQCIQQGDGTVFKLPAKHILRSRQYMRLPRIKIPAFSYNPAVFPPYSSSDCGHWYARSYNNEHGFGDKFISFITNTQLEILDYLERCRDVWLFFVPLQQQ